MTSIDLLSVDRKTARPSFSRFSGAYSPFIDGLRAISIIAVVGFHVGLPGFSGGFVGVDVFFVISGFLIINQIIAGVERADFSLFDFWARRALRILPPFTLVLAVSIAVSSVVLINPAEKKEFGDSALYAAAMAANYFFYDQQGYFDTASEVKPLLHMWTLSVEEQFYVVVPLLLVAIMMIEQRTKLRGFLLSGAIILFVASLFACIWCTLPTRNAAFFLTPFRVWEFIAGGMAATVLIPLARGLPASLAASFAAFGLAAIIVPVMIYNDRLLYPSYLALAPVIGAVVLVVAGLAWPKTMIIRLLETRSFVWIGVVSYSWYLWHWPLLSFTRIYNFGQRQMGADVLAACLALALAAATYRLVERPGKKLRSRSGGSLWLMGSMAALLLGLVGYADFILTPLVTRRAQAEWARAALPERINEWWTNGEACSLDHLPIDKIGSQCVDQPWIKSFGFLMGDSHAMTAFATYQAAARKHDIQLITRVDGSCAPLLNTLMFNKGVPMKSCMDGMRQALAALGRELPGRAPFVILKASWSKIFEHSIRSDPPLVGAAADPLSVLTDRLRLTIETFKAMGVQRILIVGPEPMVLGATPECLFRADHFGWSRDICGAERQSVEAEMRPTTDALFKAARGYDGVRVVDAVAALCNATSCPPTDGPDAIYTDGAHLTHFGEHKLYLSHEQDFEWAFTGQTQQSLVPLPAAQGRDFEADSSPRGASP